MKDREYGYFGKGLSGYAQYRTALKRTQRKGQTPAAHAPQKPRTAPAPDSDTKQEKQDGPSEGVYIFLIVGGLVLVCVVLVAINQMLMSL